MISLAGLGVLASACSAVLGIDGLLADRDGTGGAGSTSTSMSTSASMSTTQTSTSTSGGGSGCTGVCGTPGCGVCPADGIAITAAKGNYTIDAYEVTVAEYLAWLATSPSLAGQRAECLWNDSYQLGDLTAVAVTAAIAAGHPPDEKLCKAYAAALGPLDQKKPIVCVDWCDASAYCTWAKKRLCGKIGGGTIDTTPPKDATSQDPEASEWYRACSKAGVNTWPYGNTYEPARCNDENHAVTAVDKYPMCEGGYPGLFDMSGNASEWVDECTQYNDPPEAQNCSRRGGAYFNADMEDACTVADPTQMSIPSDNIGFRCCG